MSNMTYYKVQAILLLIGCLTIIVESLILLHKRKPVIVNSVWNLSWMYVFWLFPQLMRYGLFCIQEPSFGNFFFLAVYIWVGIILYFSFDGFVVYGVNPDDFKRCFFEYLEAQNYKFTKTFSSIVIANPALDVSVGYSKRGAVTIKQNNDENPEVFRQMVDHFKNIEIKYTSRSAIRMLCLGFIGILFIIWLIIKINAFGS